MQLASNLLVLAMAVTFLLLAMATTGVLSFFGYLWGILLFIATVINWTRAPKN